MIGSILALGGGCHWCTEAVFTHLRGVSRVEQGWVAAPPPDDAWSEAVIVHYNVERLPVAVLLEIHLRTHSATADHTLRGRYRSAVYYFGGAEEGQELEAVLTRLQVDFSESLLTRVLPFAAFRPSLPEHLDYYATDPERPFCKRFIDPKLALLREEFGEWV